MAMFIDVESYNDYFLIMFLDGDTGKCAAFDMHSDQPLRQSRVADLMRRNLTIGFNSTSYDLFMIEAALQGRSCEDLKAFSDEIIRSNLPAWKVARGFDVNVPRSWDHIDIIDVIPGKASLKVYAGRIGWPLLQDLPMGPDGVIGTEHRSAVKRYCLN